MDEVVRKFLKEDLKPLESNIAHFIEIQHALESEKGSASERSVKSWVILARRANGVVTDSGVRAASDVERVVPSGNNGGSSWGISSLFGGDDSRMTVKENIASKPHTEQPVHSKEQSFSTIHLREPPPILRPSESNSETDVIKITANKLLLRSYYDIVRKNVDDTIPKEIMYSLVLYCLILLELPLEAETVENGYNLPETTCVPVIHGLPTPSMYSTSNDGDDYYAASPKYPKSDRFQWKQKAVHVSKAWSASEDWQGNDDDRGPATTRIATEGQR
ncbi:hypothetical protein JHK85_035464 [Glycine max]|nr:hypothetical protein JHK85_035464 [Glycine max]